MIGILILATSCQSELIEKIASTYPNGLPSKIEYYKMEGDSQIIVKHIRFYENGEKQEEGSFAGKERNGTWTYWHENGNKWSEGNFKNGIPHGKSTVWYNNEKIRYTGSYNNGETDGQWTYWSVEGEKIKEVLFQNGEKISEESFEQAATPSH